MNIEIENQIITNIYDAALTASLWPSVIQQIVEYTDSKTAIFTALDQLNPNADFVHTFNISEQCLQAYSDERIKVIDMQLHLPLWNQIGVGGIMSLNLADYKNSSDMNKVTFYDKCLEPTGISKIAGVLLEQSQYRWAVLAIHRSPNAAEYTIDVLDFLKRIGGHIRRALQIHKQFSLIKTENQNMHSILNSMKIGILLIDENHHLHYSNFKAQKILDKNKLFEFDQFNKISVHKKDQLKFEKILNNILNPTINHFDLNGFLSLTNVQNEKFMLTISPFHHKDAFLTKNLNKKFATIFITKTNEKYHLAISYLKEQYGLSPRECEICNLFVNGFNFDEIAESCHLTMSSVRTYFKNIYLKLNCNSQTELLHKLLYMTLNFEYIEV